MAPQLICGLGNGLLGRGSRHALGLRLVERLAAVHGLSWSLYPTIGAYVAVLSASQSVAATEAVQLPPSPVYLLWSLLPYNLAGWSVAAAAKRFGISAVCVTVVHDDLDKGVGELCWKYRGSAGGNNGLKSVISSLGTDTFRRLRVGIGRPPTGQNRSRSTIVAWVLGTLPNDDWDTVSASWEVGAMQTTLLHNPANEALETEDATGAP